MILGRIAALQPAGRVLRCCLPQRLLSNRKPASEEIVRESRSWEEQFKESVQRETEEPKRARAACDEFFNLIEAVKTHQELLRANGIGVEVSERERIKVNARRVGLEAPAYLDELPGGWSERLGEEKPGEKGKGKR
mmetsp:Transcript_7713/g.23352  ORF Transcript_7713/g.23352 Transcript_7713/m.23352 type:complete len:136 (+) Transcript_7713:2356-2763(+)